MEQALRDLLNKLPEIVLQGAANLKVIDWIRAGAELR